MMEDFGTDLTTVSKVLKNAQMVSDAMEHNNAVITSDVAIFIQAKEIQLKFSEDSTTCPCWGRSFVFIYLL